MESVYLHFVCRTYVIFIVAVLAYLPKMSIRTCVGFALNHAAKVMFGWQPAAVSSLGVHVST